MNNLSTKTGSVISKLPPKAQATLSAAMSRLNRQRMVSAANAAQAPIMSVAGAGIAGVIDALVDWSFDIGPVNVTAGQAAGIVALGVGTFEGNATLASMGSGAVSVLVYNASKEATSRMVAEYL